MAYGVGRAGGRHSNDDEVPVCKKPFSLPIMNRSVLCTVYMYLNVCSFICMYSNIFVCVPQVSTYTCVFNIKTINYTHVSYYMCVLSIFITSIYD